MPDRALGHYTHEKNPVACAAALVAIEYLEEEGLVEHARNLGEYALQRMRAMMAEHEIIGDVTGLGLLMGMQLVKDREIGQRATDEAERVMYSTLTKGLNFKLTMDNIITLTPALTITQDEMDRALAIIEECLTEVEA